MPSIGVSCALSGCLYETVRSGPNGSGPGARRCARIPGTGSGETQLARHQFPASHSVPFFEYSQTARITLCETGPDPVWFRVTVSGLGQTDPVRKQAGVQESSGQVLAKTSVPDPDGMRMESGVFTREP